MQLLYSFFRPPQFDDNQRKREAKYAHYIALSLIVGYSYAVIHELLNGSTYYLVILYFSTALIILLYCLNKKKLLTYPLVFIDFALIATATAIMIMADGTRDEVLLVFPVSLIIASLAFEHKQLIMTLIIELGIIWFLGNLEMHGLLKNRFSFGTSYFQLIILSITLIFSTFIIDLIVGDFKISIQDIKDKSYEITNANKELHHLNATKDKFFSIIAHDLRSPFQGLLGIANILESLDGELTREERKNFVSRLSIALKRQYDFLEELLLWGKIQRDSIDFEPELCNLTEIAERNGEILSGNIYKKKINFKIDGPAEVNARCDENLISTVIRNLISNAIKYTPTGGKVTVAVQDMNDNVIVKVIDTGIGFSEERKKQLFCIESNSSTRGTENEPGTGLGLILCQEIMTKHLGSISVISEEGKGSTFSIQIPKNI